jgi:cyclophilin family peptidyl-prolyl cis-trans isomerase
MNRVGPRLFGFLLAGSAVLIAGCPKEETKVDETVTVLMETSKGDITIELNAGKAPITVKNFLSYVDDGFYDGTIFHRVIGTPYADRDFMIQGGGMEPGMLEKQPKPTIKNESYNGLLNKRGTIAMARTNDPDSASSQFYINVADNPPLDRSRTSPGYCVFGKVVDGMDVVDKIKTVRTTTKRRDRHEYENVPVEDVIIKSIRRVDKD